MDRYKELILRRREELKLIKKLANKYLDENIVLKNHHRKSWEYLVYENNIKNLKEKLRRINRESEDSAIEEYVQNELMIESLMNSTGTNEHEPTLVQHVLKKFQKGVETFEIIRHSPSYSVANDLYWVEEGTVEDQIEIVLGDKSPEIYGQYLQNKITKLKDEALSVLESNENLVSSKKILKAALSNLIKGNYAVANILIITLIEGIVRIICKEIYSSQNPNISPNDIDHYIYHKFTSLESLILKGDFKPDYEISLIDASLLSEHVISEELDKIQEEVLLFKQKSDWYNKNALNELETWQKLLKEENFKVIEKRMIDFQEVLNIGPMSLQEKRKISIKPRLQFLLRSFKEDRNLIIHGKYSEFDKPWKSYIYCSATLEVIKILKEYL